MKFLIVFMLMFSTYSSECVNKSLKDAGFDFAMSKTFAAIEKSVNSWLEANQEDFILEYESKIYSSVIGGFVQVTSLDNIQTDKTEMLEDLVYIRDLSSGNLLEIRWFQYGMKLVAFDRTLQSCPTPIVPKVSNKLF